MMNRFFYGTIKQSYLILVALLLITSVNKTNHSLMAQSVSAVMTFKDSTYNFGDVAEERGSVVCNFGFKNTGNAPLVINRVTSDCGCTSPDWPREAIAPGESSVIKVAYNPLGRPGPFIKRVYIYSNSQNGMKALTIKGDVSTTSNHAGLMYPLVVGPLRLTDQKFIFPPVKRGSTHTMRIKSYNSDKSHPIKVHILHTPSFITLDKTEYEVGPIEPLEIPIHILKNKALSIKMHNEPLYFEVENYSGTKSKGNISIVAPIVDDFAEYKSMEDILNGSPKLALNTYYDLGKATSLNPQKIDIEIKNEGKKTLKIEDISCENPAIKHPRKIAPIKPGQSKTLTLEVLPQVIKEKGWKGISSNVNIICNDPSAPLRKVKVKTNI